MTVFLLLPLFSSTSDYPCYAIVGSGPLTAIQQCSHLFGMLRSFLAEEIPHLGTWACDLKFVYSLSVDNNWEAIIWITNITLVIVWAKLSLDTCVWVPTFTNVLFYWWLFRLCYCWILVFWYPFFFPFYRISLSSLKYLDNHKWLDRIWTCDLWFLCWQHDLDRGFNGLS